MLVATLPLPPSSNTLYVNGTRGRHLTRAGAEYKTNVMKRLMQGGWRTKDCNPPYTFHLWLMVPDKRIRDNSNMIKAIEDAVATFLGYNDTLNLEVHVYKGLDRDNPRAVVALKRKTDPIPYPPDLREGYRRAEVVA